MALGFVILIVAGALFLFRTYLSAWILTLILEKQGARQVSLDVRRINAAQIDIERLDLIFPRGSRLVELGVENLRITFAPAQLLHGQIKDVAVQELVLRQSAMPEGDVTPPEALRAEDLLTPLSSDWHKRLPFNSARIGTLQVCGDDLPQALTCPLTLTVVRTNSGVEVECRSASSSSTTGIELKLGENAESTTLNVVAADAGELDMTLAGTHLEGSFVFDPARINALLTIFGVDALEAVDQIDSTRLNGRFALNLARWPLYEVQGQFTAKDFARGVISLKGLDLKFELKGDASAAVEQVLQNARVNLDIEQFCRDDFLLTGIAGQLKITAAPDSSYLLNDTSVLKVAKFKNAQASFESASFPLSGTFGLTEDKHFNIQLEGAPPWRLRELEYAGVSIAEASIHAALNVHLTPKEGQVTFLPDLDVALDRLVRDDMRISSLGLRPSGTVELQGWLDDGLRWRLESSRWLLSIPLVENPRMQISSGGFALLLKQFYADGHDVFLTGKAQAQWIAMDMDSGKVRLRDLILDVSLSPQGLEGEGDFLIGPYPERVSYAVKHELATERGTFRLTTPTSLQLSERLPLSRLLEPWNFPGDAVNGRINLSLDAAWSSTRAPSATADIELIEIDGTWREIKFSGLSLAHRIRLWPVLQSMNRAQLTLDLIVASGMPITQTQAIFRIGQAGQVLDAPFKVDVEEGHFNLLGSTFVLQPFTYRSDAAKNQLRIKAARLDLARLTPLFKTEGLEINGSVEAVLPVELRPDGVKMISGFMRQNGPGVIKYRPRDREVLRRAGMPDIVIRALENFHYDSLETDITYQTDGQLDLAIRLRGNSPTAGTERPFHLNLNVEQNLLSLLESLRYSEVFERKIEEYMQSKR